MIISGENMRVVVVEDDNGYVYLKANITSERRGNKQTWILTSRRFCRESIEF